VTAALTQHLLQIAGLPILRSGNSLGINGHVVNVVEACNGMRMAVPLFLAVYVFCFSLPLKAGVRVLLLLLSPAAAILCNVVRMIPTVCLYGYCDQKKAEYFHDVSGWLMLPLAFFVLLAMLWLLQRLRWEVMDKPTGPSASWNGRRVWGAGNWAAIALSALLLVVMNRFDPLRIDWHMADAFLAQAAQAAGKIPVSLPGGWTLQQDFPLERDAQAILQPNAYLNRRYQNIYTKQVVGFMLVECGDPRSMVGHYPPICYRGQGWTLQQVSAQQWIAGD